MLHLRFLNHNNTNPVAVARGGGGGTAEPMQRQSVILGTLGNHHGPRATTAVILHYNMGVVPARTLYIFKRRSTIQDIVVNI